jgi:serine/threonine-protein kinase
VNPSDTEQARSAPQTLARGRYQLIHPIGEGGIATVWRANDRVLGVERALKLLDEVAGRYPAFRSRFHTEARTMARIEHPTVMRVYDYGAENGRYYLVMELIDGGSVKDLLVSGKRIAPARALRITFDVCNALTAVHAMGAVHRDVKPGNILLAADGSSRLSDFGIVRLLDARPLHETRSDDRLGTVGYMAPEQSEDPTRVGPPADLYAVGATLFAMVTGRHPSVLAALNRRPELLGQVQADVARVIRTATAYKPEDRYPDARAMAEDVARAYDAIEGTSTSSSWMLSLDSSLETCLSRWGRKAPTGTPAPADPREQDPEATGPVSLPPLAQEPTAQNPPRSIEAPTNPRSAPPAAPRSATRSRATSGPSADGALQRRATMLAFALGAAVAVAATLGLIALLG